MTTPAGTAILSWWRRALRPAEDTSAARGLRARLRRADGALAVLAEPAVHELVAARPRLRKRPEALATLVQVLALVEAHDRRSLARVLGAGDPAAMSPLRFQALIRCEGADLGRALRRALPMAGHCCDVARLGQDILNWDDPDRGEALRAGWYFDYFGASRSGSALEAINEDLAE